MVQENPGDGVGIVYEYVEDGVGTALYESMCGMGSGGVGVCISYVEFINSSYTFSFFKFPCG